jgi:hypothetical protein
MAGQFGLSELGIVEGFKDFMKEVKRQSNIQYQPQNWLEEMFSEGKLKFLNS